MLTDPNRPPGNRKAASGITVNARAVPVPNAQTGWQTRFNARRLSSKKLRHLAVLWGLLILLCLPVVLLAPGWIYIVAGAGMYRLAYLAGLDIRLKPGKLFTKILVMLIFMALILWLIRTETSKLAGREVGPSSPISTANPVPLAPPTPVKFHR